jgi:hypothetical protein
MENETYKITKVGHGFTVECGDLFAGELTHGEAMEVVAYWMFMKKHHHYMRTYEHHLASWYRKSPTITGFLEFQPCVLTN